MVDLRAALAQNLKRIEHYLKIKHTRILAGENVGGRIRVGKGRRKVTHNSLADRFKIAVTEQRP